MTIREQYKAAWRYKRLQSLGECYASEYHANDYEFPSESALLSVSDSILGKCDKMLIMAYGGIARRKARVANMPFWIRMIGNPDVPLSKLSEVGRRLGVDAINVYACYQDYLAQRKDGVTYP